MINENTEFYFNQITMKCIKFIKNIAKINLKYIY